MGFLNVTCPSCGMEDAYHNGVEYECPNCDYLWGEDLEENDEDESESGVVDSPEKVDQNDAESSYQQQQQQQQHEHAYITSSHLSKTIFFSRVILHT